jgi:hypothetical protein
MTLKRADRHSRTATGTAPRYPSCHSVRTIRTNERLDEQMFFCAASEQSWTRPLRERKKSWGVANAYRRPVMPIQRPTV